MPANRTNIGMGRRRQGNTEPERPDDRNRSMERDLEQARGLEAADSVFEPGKQPGARGADTPHQNIKPGTRIALDDAT